MHGLGLRLNDADGAPRRSIRRRLLALALLPLGCVLPLLLAALAQWGGAYFDRLLVTKVGADLVVADSYYDRVAAGIGASVDGLAGSARLAALLAPPARDGELHDWLNAERLRLKLDFLHLLDPAGCLPAARRTAPCFAGWPVVDAARGGRSRTDNDVFPAELLAAIDPALARQAAIPLLPTRNATPDARQSETRGLVLHSAAPVHDRRGRLVGVLAGGVLLNRNLEFVDRLNAIVYPEATLPLGSAGTTTLFLGDVRIATNVRLFEGERAIGTRVSQAVHEAVLERGETWLDRAFVVSDWYFSAYRPLQDSRGERVGMLYVGFLDGPFATAKRQALFAVLLLFGLAMAAAGIFAVFWARRVFRPIERMHATMHAIESGQPAARVGPVDSADEIGELAAHFDRLLERQQAQAADLQRWGESLDHEVGRRTAELQRALADLRATQGKLVMNEKLAAIGQLTAGVAHEINNPIAVIQGNLELARELLGERAGDVEPELRLSLEQVQRIRLIVAKLLQFARPQEYVGYLEPVAPGPLLQDCLLLVGHLLKKGNIAIEQHIDTTRSASCNKNEVQQVIINLLVNAIQAMPDGGVLTLAAADWDEADMPIGLKLSVADTGPGIPPADRERLFEPFFTANKPGGHGLGLWVSRSLVERYDGRISIDDAPGGGARFTVWLRCEPLD
ncbi:MAG: cache domain-containing protein [Dechloromonas sp.]|nr:cache domain-containing protein [Dechloromonas sp.]